MNITQLDDKDIHGLRKSTIAYFLATWFLYYHNASFVIPDFLIVGPAKEKLVIEPSLSFSILLSLFLYMALRIVTFLPSFRLQFSDEREENANRNNDRISELSPNIENFGKNLTLFLNQVQSTDSEELFPKIIAIHKGMTHCMDQAIERLSRAYSDQADEYGEGPYKSELEDLRKIRSNVKDLIDKENDELAEHSAAVKFATSPRLSSDLIKIQGILERTSRDRASATNLAELAAIVQYYGFGFALPLLLCFFGMWLCICRIFG